jgi:hypothetical protein
MSYHHEQNSPGRVIFLQQARRAALLARCPIQYLISFLWVSPKLGLQRNDIREYNSENCLVKIVLTFAQRCNKQGKTAVKMQKTTIIDDKTCFHYQKLIIL